MTEEEDDLTRLSNSDDPTVLSTDHDATRLSGSISSSWPTSEGRRLEAGQAFGAYTITKLLGHGGMGEVYEAVHVETGRRVALKLLRGMMNQREDRARFLSEGRLAASISHPHTVYIFGSEEIDGMPVISMQLLPGGTLKDRVAERGPLPAAEAVAAILNVIGGLDAAASAGILHRDIKPSNCFVDVDGSVKVGDFGLSISASARENQVTRKGFQGTPQYAPPEQLRGEPLDVRADIYAVGATLFYLLTGRAPFESRDFQQLVDQVKNTPPPLAHKVKPGIPPALSALIVRCLAKDASKRPSSYADLATALRPFSGTSRPARRGIRLVAGAIDSVIVAIPVGILKAALLNDSVKIAANVSVDPWPALFSILYFALSEGIWATTPGKRLCGLRIVSTKGAVTLRQGFARSIIFQSPQLPLLIVSMIFGVGRLTDYLLAHKWLVAVASAGPTLLSILMFATMRRKNGLAAVHDLLTGTRVVTRRLDEFRQAAVSIADADAPAESGVAGARFGSFEVGKLLGDVPGGRLFEGFDSVLKRRVWLIDWAPGTAETPRARRDVDRVGRLHWLAGRRSTGENVENWDAFEAPQGAPIDPAPGGSPWKAVQGWLNDLAAELVVSERDGSMPPLSLDRLWIRHDGRAVLLDFPAPGSVPEGQTPFHRPIELLAAVARLSLANKTSSQMPVSAVAMLDRWTKKKATLSISDAEADLGALAASSEKVTRGRRLMPVALALAPIALMMFASIFAIQTTKGKTGSGRMFMMLAILSEANKETDPRRRQAFETYVAGTYRAELTDESLWKNIKDTDDDDKELPALRESANRAAALHPTPEETATARYVIEPALDKVERKRDETSASTIFVILVLVGCGMSFFGGLVSVLARPSGLVLSALGLAVVTSSGREISRFRAVLRLVIAWSPMAVFCILAAIPQTQAWAKGNVVPSAIALALMAAGVIWTALRPTRGPHDIAARTTIGVR